MRHLDRRVVYDLVTLPPIVRRVQGILEPHLLLWACTMWLKDPGGREVPWHQDRNYWPVEPIVNVTAWIAVDPVTPSNGCLEVIPGSHRTVVPHVAAPPGKWFSEQADPRHVDPAGARRVLLEPGQFVLFNDRLLHRSAVNRSPAAPPRHGAALHHSDRPHRPRCPVSRPPRDPGVGPGLHGLQPSDHPAG